MRTEGPTYEPDTRREEEDARQQRWTEFVAWLQATYRAGWQWAVFDAARSWDRVTLQCHGYAAHQPFVDFAETEGWSGVLAAISQAMREEERFLRELMDRR